MLYERIAYMCPKCYQGHFFNNAEEFSTICPECNVEMVCVGKKFTSTEQEEREETKWKRLMSHPSPLVCCPYCNSANTSKISTVSKVINTAILAYLVLKGINSGIAISAILTFDFWGSHPFYNF